MLDDSTEIAAALDGEVLLPRGAFAEATLPRGLPLTALASALESALRGLLPAPRLLTRAQAAHYCGLSESAFDDWQRKGLLPRPIAGRKRWDRRAIDRHLDAISGLTSEADDEAESWLRRHDA